MTTTDTDARAGRAQHPPAVRRPAPTPPRPGQHLGAAATTIHAWVRPALIGLLLRHRRPLPVGPGRLGVGEHLLLRSRAGRVGVVEGVLLRLLRRGELDHRRQDAPVAVADGARGEGLRPLVVDHPGAAGAGGGCRGRPAPRDRPAYDGIPVRRAAQRPGSGDHTGRGADVPLQQPGRAAGAVAGRLRLRDAPRRRVHDLMAGHPVRWLALGGALVGLGVPHQDAAGVPGAPGARPGLPGRADTGCASASATCWSRSARCCGRRLVDRDRLALAGVEPSVHRRLADQLDPRAHARLQRLRPAHRRGDRLRRRRRGQGGGGWGATGILRLFDSEIGGQVAWLLPASLVLLVAGLWFTRRPPAPTWCAPGSWSGAPGCWSPR